MNRIEFIKQLESLLQNISPTEREEALQYYNDYFNDAGVENEQDVIEALGNPAKVAETIKRDLYGAGFEEAVFQKSISSDKAVVEYGTAEDGKNGNGGYGSYRAGTQVQREKKMSTGMVVLIVVLCVLASPVLISVAAGVVSLVVGLAAGWFGMVLGFGITAIVLLVVMLCLIAVGISGMLISPVGAMGLIGGGLICGGIGILFLMLTVAMVGIATPAVIKWAVGLFSRRKAAV